jgi:hypothetical protein
LPYRFVGTTSSGDLEGTIEDLLTRRASETERLLELRTRTWQRYCDLIRPQLALP